VGFEFDAHVAEPFRVRQLDRTKPFLARGQGAVRQQDSQSFAQLHSAGDPRLAQA
jgi:hypothetical protein